MALKGLFGFRTQGQDMLMGKKQRREAATRERLLDAAECFGNRTGVRKPDSKLLRLDARYPVLLQTRHPRPVPGNQGRKSFLWSGWREVVV
jgi:hypothetical protein